MSRRQPPNEAQPVVQKLRVRYAKTGRMRFASHRDFQRALERAVRRSGLPIAFSGGFSPHPRIAYANAAPTGAASEAEYVELGLREEIDPGGVPASLTEALPVGFEIRECVRVTSGSVADRLEASIWQLELQGCTENELREAVDRLDQAGEVTVDRLAKSGVKQVPVGAAILSSEIASAESDSSGPACAILRVVVRHETPSVRPEDVLTALVEHADLAAPAAAGYTRLAQGPLIGEPVTVGDPFSEIE